MSNNRNSVPILFLIFNRPDTTKKVFECIRQTKPHMLFIAADGPRVGVDSDIALCAETRQVVDLVDWDCQVHTLFRESNLGCKNGVRSAIDWFFENVEEGIILEDDCVPHPSFFRYCQELLAYYRTEKRIMMIGGNSSQFGQSRTSDSYYFSAFSHIWGWATWRRAWELNDSEMKTWPEIKETTLPRKIMLTRQGMLRIQHKLDEVYSGALSSWAYTWQYSCWLQNGLCIVPDCNLVSNVGYGISATHTKAESILTNIKSVEIFFPLTHPSEINRNLEADRFIINRLYLHYPLIAKVGLPIYIYARLRNNIPRSLRWRLDRLLNYFKTN